MENIIQQNESTASEVRRLVYGLCPPALDELGVVEAVRDLVRRGGRQLHKAVDDSAYDNEENYDYLEQEGMEILVQYNTMHQEIKPCRKAKPFGAENMPYDAVQDAFTCPNQQLLCNKTTWRVYSQNSYQSKHLLYERDDCGQCPLKEKCTRAQGNRQLQASFRLRQMCARAKKSCSLSKEPLCASSDPLMWKPFSDASNKIGASAGSSCGVWRK